MKDHLLPAPSRRGFLAGLAALGAGALLPGCETTGGTSSGNSQRVDVHHHIAYPAFREQLKKYKRGHPAWSIQRSLEDMDRSGIQTSVTSLIAPEVWLGDAAFARKAARESNDFAARLRSDHPGRFGMFASIPFPDAEGGLREIEYAYDTLKAEGIYAIASYDGKYLGDPAFTPVLEELNRRKAVVYTHPLTPACCRNVVPGVADSVIEYAVDTTRSIASLLFSGAAARFPDIRWIFSHSGGVTPFLLSRFLYEEKRMKDKSKLPPGGFMHELRKFYYDTAQGNHAGALTALMKMVPVSQVLYGTDFPYRGGAEVNDGLAQHGFTAAELAAINRGNALRLLPRLKS